MKDGGMRSRQRNWDYTSKVYKNELCISYFDNSNSLDLGTEQKEYDGSIIRVFSRERMLVELIRHKKKLPFDYYKEIIASYRKLLYQLDIQAVEEYAEKLPKTKLVMETLQMEVFWWIYMILDNSDKRWLDNDINEVFDGILTYLSYLKLKEGQG